MRTEQIDFLGNWMSNKSGVIVAPLAINNIEASYSVDVNISAFFVIWSKSELQLYQNELLVAKLNEISIYLIHYT